MENTTVVSAEEMRKAALGALEILKDNLPENCKLSIIGDEEDIVVSALKRHGEHLSTHTIKQKHIDPFKLLCWVGCAIIKGLDNDDLSYHQHNQVLGAVINSLEETLMLETDSKIRLSPEDRVLLQRLMIEEIKNNGDHGIGFNGLFVAFHCYRSTYRQLSGC